MNVKNPITGIYEWRDVLMHGINFYRTRAMRTGEYMGMNEPEFGEEVTEKLGDITITYPKWCKVVVKRKIGKYICEYVAKEFWKENYATASGKGNEAPNQMWKRRTWNQLAKCTKAQALREAFPECVPAGYTREEMEGKTIESSDFEYLDSKNSMLISKKGNEGVRQLLDISDEPISEKEELPQQSVEPSPKEELLATEQEIEQLRSLIETQGLMTQQEQWLKQAKVENLEELKQKTVQAIIQKYSNKEN